MSEIVAFEEKKNIIDRHFSDIVVTLLKTIKAMCENDYLIADGKFTFKLDEGSTVDEEQSAQILQR